MSLYINQILNSVVNTVVKAYAEFEAEGSCVRCLSFTLESCCCFLVCAEGNLRVESHVSLTEKEQQNRPGFELLEWWDSYRVWNWCAGITCKWSVACILWLPNSRVVFLQPCTQNYYVRLGNYVGMSLRPSICLSFAIKLFQPAYSNRDGSRVS